MIATKPDVQATGRYSVNETIGKLGISRRTLYTYIEKKTITVQYRKANSKPFFTGLEILRVWNATL
jgi:hypothetical protein